MAIDMVDLNPCIGMRSHADGSALASGRMWLAKLSE
jgi:hypothetical protein